MIRFDAMEEEFEELTFMEQQVLFTCSRLNHDTIPDGLHLYELRHCDEDDVLPAEITPYVILVNFMGTIITKEEIDIDNCGYKILDPYNDWDYTVTGDCTSIEDFLKIQ